MSKRIASGILAVVWLAVSLQAVVPQKWEIRTKEDFLKGKFNGVSMSFDGLLYLAPKEEKLAGPSEEFYLSFLPLPDGSAYLGTGHGGKIYLIGKDGKADIYFQTSEMDVTCLVRNGQGELFAGTSPNGKIYKITQKGKGEAFFDPGEKYIWDLMFDEKGSLLAAVGEGGGIYEINSQGEGRQLLKTGENHILCLREDPQGVLFAGSGGGGLVYRLIRGEGRTSVLFESPYEEVRSLALDKAGNIYASASGTPIKSKRDEGAILAGKVDAEASVTVTPSGAEAQPAAISGPTEGKEPSALYKISPAGVAKKLWSSTEELIYSLIWRDEDQSILFGTGNKGRIYSINKEEKISLLLQKDSEQVYLFLPWQTKTYVLANNPGSLSVLSSEQRLTGDYLSGVLDAKTVSSWGRIEWISEIASGTTLQLLTRSGNSYEPDATWSDWSPPYQSNHEQVLSPKARFLQFKAILRTQSGKYSPTLQKTDVFYLQTNIAPEFSKIDLLGPNEVLLKMPEQDDVILGLDSQAPPPSSKKDALKSPSVAKKADRKGFQTVVWSADDDNGDDLIFSISVKKEGDPEWRLLQPRWEESVFAFDTSSFPDGAYFLKVTASDAPSNPQGTELRADKISPPFLIDNSLPAVKNFAAVRNGGGVDVSFQAEDAYSFIEEVKYLIRPDDWRVVFPVDGICDSKIESFKFTIKLIPGLDDLITVRVKDGYGNIGVLKQTY